MQNIPFSVFSFGAFDHHLFSRTGPGPQRKITMYEFEFYTEDSPNGLCNDGVLYPSRKGYCCLTKPGQQQQEIRPYRGYYLNVYTDDTELCDMLDNLPSYFPVWNVSEITKLINKMVALEDSGSLENRLKIYSYALRILVLLSHYRTKTDVDNSGVYRHRKTLAKADRYLQEHLSEEISLGELAKLCNLDPSYFHKLFTAAFGKTPAQRLLGFRISAAKTSLLENKKSLSEIATSCGFSSQAYFCYRFKKTTGKSPLQYRNDMLGNTKN